jgi:dTDP-4-amino-4,6-dideoxygalactose transaminase
MPKIQKATRDVLSLPVHPGLSEDDLGRIGKSVKGFYS